MCAAPISTPAADDRDRGQRVRQLVNDCIRRRAKGESISDESLIQAHPDLLPELADELRNLRLIQQAQRQVDSSATVDHAALRIRCPHCHHPVELVNDSSLSDVVCPSCGSHFGLVDPPQSFQVAELETVGHFKLLDKLGVGAFGSVWSARDTELDRTVAIKIPRKGQISAADTEQFIREARATAQLNHPNIVRVYEVGREGDRVYIVTDCVEGVDLAEWLTAHHATPREAAELCAKLADALHHAHERGVIHRDLKPSNIMLDTEGEPHLMDFGLAKREAGEITMTVEGKLLGTPAYMPPEQARGSAHDADRRSDVYSLGVILFELMTGERPFRGSTRMLLHQILAEDAPSPRRLNGAIPRDLETICLKCLEKAPERRYQTAAELRDDLHRYLHGEPVVARPVTRAGRSWRWCRRNPVVASLGVAVTALLTLLAIGGPSVAWKQIGLRKRAEQSETKAVESAQREGVAHRQAATAAERYRRLLYSSDVNLALQSWDEANVVRTQQLLSRQLPLPDQDDLRGFEWHYLWRLCRNAERTSRLEYKSPPCSTKFNPQGSLLAIGFYDGTIRLMDAKTRREVHVLHRHEAPVWGLGFSPDGAVLASGCWSLKDPAVTLWDVANGVELRSLVGAKEKLWSACFSPDGKTVISGDATGRLYLWDSSSGRLLNSVTQGAFVANIAVTADGSTVVAAAGDNDGTVSFWDLRALCAGGPVEPSATIAADRLGVWSVAVAPDGRTLATGGRESVFLWDLQSHRMVRELKGHRATVMSLDFSRDGQLLLSAAFDNTVRLWEVGTGTLLETFKGHSDSVYSASFAPDHDVVVSVGRDKTVRFWDAAPQKRSTRLLPHEFVVGSVAFSPDGRYLASAEGSHGVVSVATGRFGRISLWATADWQPHLTIQGHYGGTTSLSFSPDGKTLATGGHDNKIRLWDAQSGQQFGELPGHEGAIQSVAFSCDGLMLATAGAEGTVKVWSATKGKHLHSLQGHRYQVNAVACSPCGSLLASADGKVDKAGTVILWDLATGREVNRLTGHESGIGAVAFSPDGRLLATGSYDCTVRLWNVNDGTLRTILSGHTKAVACVAFSPNGRRLASAGEDHTVRLWDPQTGEERATFPGEGRSIHSLAFSPDGLTMATGSTGKVVRIWSASEADPPP